MKRSGSGLSINMDRSINLAEVDFFSVVCLRLPGGGREGNLSAACARPGGVTVRCETRVWAGVVRPSVHFSMSSAKRKKEKKWRRKEGRNRKSIERRGERIT